MELTTDEHALVQTKNRANRLPYAFWLVFFREHGRFPLDETEVDEQFIETLCEQLGLSIVGKRDLFILTDRTAERTRAEIRTRFGYREATVLDGEMLELWLRDHIAPNSGGEVNILLEGIQARCRELRIESPTLERNERIARDALNAYEECLYDRIFSSLPEETRGKLDALLQAESTIYEDDQNAIESVQIAAFSPATLLKLRANPGRPSLASMQEELDKLILIRHIGVPNNLFDHVSLRDVDQYHKRVFVQEPHELRRLSDKARLTYLAAFIYLRGRSLTDNLVDLLVETIHHIGARAERKVERELLEDLKRVSGKQNLLFEIANASLSDPNGSVRDVVFPVVSEQKLHELVKEWKATGPTYRLTLRTVIRNSYRGHYRRMIPKLLNTLEFRSNNHYHKPVMNALNLGDGKDSFANE